MNHSVWLPLFAVDVQRRWLRALPPWAVWIPAALAGAVAAVVPVWLVWMLFADPSLATAVLHESEFYRRTPRAALYTIFFALSHRAPRCA